MGDRLGIRDAVGTPFFHISLSFFMFLLKIDCNSIFSDLYYSGNIHSHSNVNLSPKTTTELRTALSLRCWKYENVIDDVR